MYHGNMQGLRIIEMNNFEKKWKINNISLEDFPDKDEIIDHLLELYEFPSLFETSNGFSELDGCETIFMLDRLFEIKLVNNVWEVFCEGNFSHLKIECENILANDSINIWEKICNILKILSIPDSYSYQLLLGYSMARFIENLPDMKISKDEPEFLLRVYKYQVKYRENSKKVEIYELCKNDEKSKVNEFISLATEIKHNRIREKNSGAAILKLRTPKKLFLDSVKKAKDYIKKGDIYQVQLCREEISTSNLSPIEVFMKLRKYNPSPYMSFIDFGNGSLISSSPEVMIRVKENKLQVRPIAGTIKSSASIKTLASDPKENAEHLMLVDLARNDLAKSNKGVFEDIDVKYFMQEENYGRLTHLVSTIETKLDTYDILDIIQANFPSGTMVGAPKIRAMEIISELEAFDRGIFTGACGYVNSNESVLSLIIRSIVGRPGDYRLRAAAGVVSDSSPLGEWNEAGEKIKSFSNIFYEED